MFAVLDTTASLRGRLRPLFTFAREEEYKMRMKWTDKFTSSGFWYELTLCKFQALRVC